MSNATDLVILWGQRYPALLRRIFDWGRGRAPVMRAAGALLVTGADEVREVFERADDLLFGHGNAPKMKFGPFLLGMDLTAQYRDEKRTLGAALFEGFPAGRTPRGAFTTALETSLAQGMRDLGSGRRRVDLVAEFVEPVIARAFASFYGLDLDRMGASPYLQAPAGVSTYCQCVRKIGALVASTYPAPFGLELLARKLADHFKVFLEENVAVQPAFAGEEFTTLISYLKARGVAEEVIVRNVGGALLAGGALAKGFVLALHELLSRPELGTAVEAAIRARSGGQDAQVYAEEVLDHMLEASRFRPVFALLPRYCVRSTVLFAGTRYRTVVEPGATVFVSPLAAMFDPRRVERPDEYLVGRPRDLYLHFGHGTHRCLGKPMAEAGLGAMASALLTRTGMADAKPGRMRWDGPVLAGYELTLPDG